jgi:predicted ribosomally synthesized peptide with SipW-like signal peptide
MKKYILIAVSAVLLVALSVGTTVAFLTDRDETVNVFTVGSVEIELVEDYVQNSKLVPGKDINKDIQIENKGDNAAWVWYTYAIPAALDNDSAANNVVHINHAGRNWLGYQENQNYWENGQTEPTDPSDCWIVDAYVTKNVSIDGILYNVYTVLYNGILQAGEITTVGLTNVYLDSKVDYNINDGKYYLVENGVVTPINHDLAEVKIIVNAYAIQADGFTSVQEAYAAYAGQWGLTVPTNP